MSSKKPGSSSLGDWLGEALFVGVGGLVVYAVWKKSSSRGDERVDVQARGFDVQARGTYTQGRGTYR